MKIKKVLDIFLLFLSISEFPLLAFCSPTRDAGGNTRAHCRAKGDEEGRRCEARPASANERTLCT